MKIDITDKLKDSSYLNSLTYINLAKSWFIEKLVYDNGMNWTKEIKVYQDNSTLHIFLEQEDKYMHKYTGDKYDGLEY